VQFARVVDEKAGALAVLLQKVLRRDFQGFQDAFADGDAGHHDDELAPAVAGVQLEHRAHVAIGLAGAGLHLDVEVDAADARLDEGGRHRQVLAPLRRLDVLQKLSGCERQVGIAEPWCLQGGQGLAGGVHGSTGIHPVLDAFTLRLAAETVGHGLHSVQLVRLLLELQLHANL